MWNVTCALTALNVQYGNTLGSDGARHLAGALKKLKGMKAFKLVSGIATVKI